MRAHGPGTSPRDGSGYTRLMAIAKDHENMLVQLIASSNGLELQLKGLRAEHEALRVEAQALRRCLDRAGVLPASELDKEIRSCSAEVVDGSITTAAGGKVSPLAGAGTGWPACSACTVHSRQAMPMISAAEMATSCGPSPAHARRRAADSPRRSGLHAPADARARGADLGMGAAVIAPSAPEVSEALAVNGLRPTSPSKGGRGRSLHKSTDRSESAEDAKGRPRSRSSHRVAEEQEPTEVTGVPDGDLYELISKLLDQSSSVVEQQRAVRSVQQLLKRGSETPNVWSGPGTPLSAVVRAGRSDLARLLLRARANVNERDAKGVSALHVATYDGNMDLCRVLLVARADVDACDRHGQTPLFFVPNKDICKLLIERRSDVTVLNRKGQSALHLAGRAGLHEVLAWLASRVSKSLAELRDVHGATAKLYVQQSGVPKPEAASPRSSGGRRAASPRAKSRTASPRLGPRAASPRGPLRGGGGGAQAKAAASEPPPSDAAPPPRNELRRGSGQLPYVSELVEGRPGGPIAAGASCNADLGSCHSSSGDWKGTSRTEKFSISAGDDDPLHQARSASPPTLEAMYEGFDNIGQPGRDMALPQGSPHVAQHAAAVLEAAAAVATAAVATAAELEAAQAAESAEEARAFDHEADSWPVQSQAEDLAELGVLEDGVAEVPAAAEAAATTKAQEKLAASTPRALASDVDLSEIRVVNETGEDLAELGVMDDDEALARSLSPTAHQILGRTAPSEARPPLDRQPAHQARHLVEKAAPGEDTAQQFPAHHAPADEPVGAGAPGPANWMVARSDATGVEHLDGSAASVQKLQREAPEVGATTDLAKRGVVEGDEALSASLTPSAWLAAQAVTSNTEAGVEQSSLNDDGKLAAWSSPSLAQAVEAQATLAHTSAVDGDVHPLVETLQTEPAESNPLRKLEDELDEVF